MKKLSNKTFKSILESYSSKEYDKLISMNETQDREVHKGKSREGSVEKLHIPIKTGEIDLGIEVDIEMIYDVNDVNINAWLEVLESVIQRNGWTGDIVRFLFRDLIRDSRFAKISFTASFEENRKLIYGEVFPLEKVNAMLAEAEANRQIHYKYIQEYYESQKEILDIYSTVAQCSKAEYERRLNEMFSRGLGRETRNYLLNSKIKGACKMMKELKEIEVEVVLTYNLKNMKFSRKFLEKNDKWCREHRQVGHTTKECNSRDGSKDKDTKASGSALKKKNEDSSEKNNTNKEVNSYFITEVNEDVDSISLNVILDQSYRALI